MKRTLAGWGALALSAGVWLGACGSDAALNAGTAEAEAGSVAAPLAGADLADRSCRVVLRSASRATGPTGVETECVDGKCWFVFTAEVDVDLLTWNPAREVGLLYRSSLDGSWREARAERVKGARVSEGFLRHQVRFAEHTLATGLSTTTLSRAQVELIPFVRTARGERLFDHNFHTGALDNYALSAANGFALEVAPKLCPGAATPRATLSFKGDFSLEQQGVIQPGGRLVVDYALERMPQCMGSTYQGYATWNTQAFVRFSPGGQQYVGDVKGFEDLHGQQWYAQPFEVDVPKDATQVELWFEHTGLRCQTQYDSQQGRNYRFPVGQ